MFLGFSNFYRRFIKGFSRIIAFFISILKRRTSSASEKPRQFRYNKKKSNMYNNGRVVSGKMNNRDIYLLSNIKKLNFEVSFLIFKAQLAFT